MTKLDSVVDLQMLGNDNVFYNKHRADLFVDWLTDNDIEYKFIKAYYYDSYPHTILLNSVDALAFKLRFEL